MLPEIKIKVDGFYDDNDKRIGYGELSEWIRKAKIYVDDLEKEVEFLRKVINEEKQ